MDPRPRRKFDRPVGASMSKKLFWLAAAAGTLALSGCAHVSPWQRDALSRPGMQLDPYPLISACDDHVYFSREASKGGRSFGGGGCGCN
jgi:hypothetical protein